jgi:hypothetical protein
VAQVVEGLPSKHKAFSSNPNAKKKKKKNKKTTTQKQNQWLLVLVRVGKGWCFVN